MKKLKFTISLLLLFACIQAFPQTAMLLKGKVDDFSGKKAYFLAIKGNKKIKIDSTSVVKGCFQFVTKNFPTKGMYRVWLNDSLNFDIVINNEPLIVVESNAKDIIKNFRVLSSYENMLFYKYLSFNRIKNTERDSLSLVGKKLFETDKVKNKDALNLLISKIDSIDAKIEDNAWSLVNANPKLFSAELIKSLLAPRYSDYRKNNPTAPKYKTMNDFYKDHFFDNINFVDTNLLNTDILYKAFSGYLTTFSETPSTENYKQLCDFILSQTNKTKSVFDYALTLLIQTFEASDYDEVFIYLTEKYFLQTTCDQDIKAKTLAEKVAALKSLKIGKVAPDIALPDSTGKLVELKNVKNKLVLLLFWSSQCEHCEAMMPQLKKVYEKYKSLGLEILAVSMDTDKNSWLTAIRKNKMEWINVSDLKSINGEFAKKYNVWQTPTFIMLNQDQKIIAKPFTPKQIDEKLGEIL